MKKCRGCNMDIIYGKSYKRYYCSKECFEANHSQTHCIICNEVFLKTRKTSVICEDCLSKMFENKYSSQNELYGIYISMIYRCYNKERINYKFYGGKGITVSNDWLSFENFLKDMSPTFHKGLTLDRIYNEKCYSRENCRWVTIEEQRKNRGRFRTATNVRKNISLYRGKYKVSIRHNTKRIYLGLFNTLEEAIITHNTKVKELYPNSYELYILEENNNEN